ncbi:hypothetical protein [Iningainema tapete]|uniref:Uncharacterized protein n=1 Tax=Iningainema tapete BLCC-T55 TaxID=2748662 RepID=A0A8J6XNJ2_9CYAN|nr:hypothetical protein [Iningainema tapete]MBD2770968.1 hypothetical protein [Iningainema tapete BLCC-T55]
MFLPQLPQQETKKIEIEIKIAEKTRLVKNLRNWAIYTGCFSGGLFLAFLPRLNPGLWIFYGIALISIVGYLIAVKPVDATEESLSLRRLAGLAVIISVIGGHWDGMILFASKPILVANSVLPLWIAAISLVGIVIILLFISILLWRMADDKSQQNPFK